jgi:hypothetical protein
MNLDRLIHPSKNFAELTDADVDQFLTVRAFGSENLNIEFKQQFPQKPQSTKYEIRDVCKYIVGFSNEGGGLVLYGVSDNIKDPGLSYPSYLKGLQNHPSLEDLSSWIKGRVHPLIASPSIRFFTVGGHKIAVLKIPEGVNKPYCYHDPAGSVAFFKKTSGGIVELSPGEIREFHHTQMLGQAIQVTRAAELQGISPGPRVDNRSSRFKHQEAILPKLESPNDFGLVGIYCLPATRVELPVDTLAKFLESHRFRFSEFMHYLHQIDTFQNGVSAGYFPRAIRTDVKSTARFTLYRDGLVAFDALADTFMNGDKTLNPIWLAYEIQRQLQLAKALLKPSGVQQLRILVDLVNVEDFSMAIEDRWQPSSKYAGPHEPVIRDINFDEIHDFDGSNRNVIMPLVQNIMDEISRIFGFSKAWPGIQDSSGRLAYVKGLENQR